MYRRIGRTTQQRQLSARHAAALQAPAVAGAVAFLEGFLMCEWRDVPSVQGLRVSDSGVVILKGRTLRPYQDCKPGHGAIVRVKVSGVRRTVSRLVVEAFLGVIPQDVHHLNGDPADNRLENLSPVSKAEHSYRHRNPQLSARDIAAIRSSHEESPVVARRYGLSASYIRAIRTGHSPRPHSPVLAELRAAPPVGWRSRIQTSSRCLPQGRGARRPAKVPAGMEYRSETTGRVSSEGTSTRTTPRASAFAPGPGRFCWR